MQYKIVVDKQPRTNPSSEKKEYIVDIEELRIKGGTYDSLVITKDEDYVMRRLELTEYHVLNVLEVPIKETLEDINIELFEGDNYIYLVDMTGNKFYAEYMVKNDLTELYATKLELSTSIEQTAQDIMLVVNKKVDEEEFGTLIEQNAEAIKFAWNQISEFIQLMIINNNASFAILDSSKKPIAYFDKTGIHFSSNNTAFGEMGVQTVDGNKFISFSVDGTYGSSISNGMAWGIKTTTDNKFHPIFYIKNFEMGPLNSDASYGELVLSACNLVLDGIGTGMKSGGVFLNGDPTGFGLYFWDEKTNKSLLAIHPKNVIDYASITILDNIKFYANQAGSNSFKLGTGDNYCLFTDTGDLHAHTFYIDGDSDIYANLHCSQDISADGNMYAQNFISDRRLKKNIKNAKDNALDIINKMKIHSFDWKEDNSHVDYGFIAQELEEIDENYVLKQEIKNKKEEVTDYKYYVNELPIIATLTKAIQEQQLQIEELQKEIKELKGGK